MPQFPGQLILNSGQGRMVGHSPLVEVQAFSATLAEINAAKTIVPGLLGFTVTPLDLFLRVVGDYADATDLRISTLDASPVDVLTVPVASLRDGAVLRPGAVGGSISPLRSVSQVVDFGAMTDGGGAAGTLAFTNTIPAGAKIQFWRAVVVNGFTGDTTAVIKVGVAGDDDRFSADTAQSVLAAGTVGSAPLAADVLDGLSAAVTPLVTVTGGSDFGNIAAGSMTVTVFYLDPAQDDDTAAVLGAGFLAAGTAGVGLQIRKTGSTATGGTSVNGWISYQLQK